MGAFDDAVTTAMEVWFSEDFTDEITYGGAEIPAHVSYGENRMTDVRNASVIVAQIMVRVSDVPDPAVRDIVAIGGVAWSVVRIIDGDGVSWNLLIERDVRPTFGGA